MKLASVFGWGIGIYATMFLLWSAFTAYGFTLGALPRLIGLCVLVVVATLAGRSLRFHRWKDILPYSISWVFVIAILDAILSVPFTGWQLYADWNVWVGYTLVALIPLFSPYTLRSSDHPDVRY